MKILLAVCSMHERSGAEWFVYDLALALNSMGHSIILYAPVMDDMVAPLRYRSIACITDLYLIAVAPDIIISNTQAETILCLAHFPQVPLISICHDRTASHGRPPILSRIRKYVAVDENCAERLMLENGIADSQIVIIQNGVDLTRFKPRPPLPKKPKQAAIFSNYATDSKETEAIRTVCSDLGIELTVIGEGSNNQATTPEHLLGKFDLVFAKARCAMEAMAVGCAVILLNETMGMAGMVTPANMVQWHALNFGRKLLQQPIEGKRIQKAIEEYSPSSAAEVSAYIWEHGNLMRTVNAFQDLIHTVIEEEPLAKQIEPIQEMREFARYFHESGILVEQGIKRINRLTREMREQHQLVVRVHELLDWQKEQLEQQGKRLVEQELQFAGTKAELDLIKNSSIWRLTAPLRKAKRILFFKRFMTT
jgi:hypothetical protein